MATLYDAIGGLLLLAAFAAWFMLPTSAGYLLLIASAVFLTGASILSELQEIRKRLEK